jgi:uncharacterized membrane protein YoaK (UPF0700 family)
MMRRDVLLVALSALAAGYLEIICITHYKTYAGFQTGNMLNIGIAVVHANAADAFYYAAIVAANFLGAALHVGLEQKTKSMPSRFRKWLAVAVIGVPVLTTAIVESAAGSNKWHMLLLSAAMGAQNSLTTAQLEVPTTIATGQLQFCAKALALHLANGKTSPKFAKKLPLSVSVVSCTVFGALLAGAAIRLGDSPLAASLLWPAAASLGLLAYFITARDEDEEAAAAAAAEPKAMTSAV